MSEQTVKILIRLLLRSSLIRIYTVCHSFYIFWRHYFNVKLNCFILRTTTVAGLGVPIFRVFTVCLPAPHHWKKHTISKANSMVGMHVHMPSWHWLSSSFQCLMVMDTHFCLLFFSFTSRPIPGNKTAVSSMCKQQKKWSCIHLP